MFKKTIAPNEVIPSLKPHMLVDGFDVVLDMEKTRGPWVVDARGGRTYVDFFSYIASVPLGLNHPKMMSEEVIRYLGRLAVNKPTNSDVYTTAMAEFVDTFFRVAVPSYLPHSFYTEGGSVAVENTLKAAFDWKVQKNMSRGYTPERGYADGHGHKVIHFKHCFHGRTGYSLSLTDSHDPAKTRWFPKFEWPRVTSPAATFPLEGENLARTIELERRAVREIEEALARYKDDIACLIIEPIQGEGGDNHFRPEFHRELRRLADEREFLLIYDEVQTGLGPTGEWWAHQNYGIMPDIISFGKKTQVCGILCGRRIEENEHHVFNTPSRLNSTWGGNLVDMARSRLYLEIMEEENILENVRREGAHLLSRLHEMAGEMEGVVGNVRGRGLMCAFDLGPQIDRAAFLREALRLGVIILPCGTRSIRFRPALNIDREALDEGLARVRSALKAVYKSGPGARTSGLPA
jgi:L-lysine 6-transaminase